MYYIRPLIICMYFANKVRTVGSHMYQYYIIWWIRKRLKILYNSTNPTGPGNPTNNKIAYFLQSGQNVPKSCSRMIHFILWIRFMYVGFYAAELVPSFFHHIFIESLLPHCIIFYSLDYFNKFFLFTNYIVYKHKTANILIKNLLIYD